MTTYGSASPERSLKRSSGDPLLLRPDADVFTHGSASSSTDLAMWGVHVVCSDNMLTEHRDPVIPDPRRPN